MTSSENAGTPTTPIAPEVGETTNTMPSVTPVSTNTSSSGTSVKPKVQSPLILLVISLLLIIILALGAYLFWDKSQTKESDQPNDLVSPSTSPTIQVTTVAPTSLPNITSAIDTRTYTSPILENFSFKYPSSWKITVEEVDDLSLVNIKSNLITLSKLDHSLTIKISPTVLFGGEMNCYKYADITFEYADNLVRVYKHKLFSDYSEKDFVYFPSEKLDSKDSNPTRYNNLLTVWTPDVEDDEEHVACGSLDFTTTVDSIYTYGDLENNDGQSGNPDNKIRGIIRIEGAYSSAQIDSDILEEMDEIVSDILER